MNVKSRRGVTLVELMVAVAILAIAILGFVGSFRYISISLRLSRARILANNLCQEKIESLKNNTYYQLLITTNSAQDSSISPAVLYDTANYPPETITIGNITFTRYTYVTMVQVNNDVITAVSFNYPDTGMKQIQVNVLWTENGTRKSHSLSNLLENPNLNPLDSNMSGNVVFTGGTAFPGAKITLEENPAYQTTSDATGKYTFHIYHGSYTVRASSAGYFDVVSPIQVVTQGSNTSVPNLTMVAIGSGTLVGTAWINPNIVVSQIVADTYTKCGDGNFHDVQYVELFNPTTFPVTIASGGVPVVSVGYNRNGGDLGAAFCGNSINITFVNNVISSGSYYLLANATSFQLLGGTQINADAYWGTSGAPDYTLHMLVGKSGCVYLTTNCSGSTNIDAVGWTNNGGATPPSSCINGNVISLAGQGGLATGNQIVRVSSPLVTSNTLGRAYNSGNNANDFLYPYSGFSGLSFQPYSTSNSSQPVIAGVPAIGAYVSASDPFSGSTQAYAASIASGSLNLLYAPFTLTGVSTTPAIASCAGNCWSVDIASNGYYANIATVSVLQGQIVSIPNANSVPAWTIANIPSVMLTSSTLNGFIKGTVTDVNNKPLNNISVKGASASKTTGSNGNYFFSISSGVLTLLVNSGNANPAYIQEQFQPTINTGQITVQDVVLTLGASITGYATSGTTPLPNIVFSANLGGSQAGVAPTDSSGNFSVNNVATGTYTVQPALDPNQASNPASVSVTITSTGSVSVGTFTITGALGTIIGTVQNNGNAVTTGALILASNAAQSNPPPAVYASSSPALANPVYAISSLADGTYTLQARIGQTYVLSAYLPSINGNSVTTLEKTYANVVVSTGAPTVQNISFP